MNTHPDALAGYVYAAYYTELSSICAWHDGRTGMWDDYADGLPEMVRAGSRFGGLGELVEAMLGMSGGAGGPSSSGFRYSLVCAGDWWYIEDAHRASQPVGEYSAGEWVRAVRECVRLNAQEEGR